MLYDNFGSVQSYILPIELERIIIPLAGVKSLDETYVKCIFDFRKGKLDLRKFPDCAPGSNDKRMIREFLLFLSHYGFCQLVRGKNNNTDQFFIKQEYMSEIKEITSLSNNKRPIQSIIEEIRTNDIITNTERQKILTKVLARPNQAQFRKQVLSHFDNTCILTGEKMNIVLEACHIVPVEHNGVDSFINGLCMRADIHTLFDAKHIRFHADGIVEYSDAIQQSESYGELPQQIIIPPFISKEALAWRFDYY